jgi:hypothetical protein
VTFKHGRAISAVGEVSFDGYLFHTLDYLE